MHFFITHKWLSLGLVILITVTAFFMWQILFITMHYRASVPAPAIPRSREQFGTTGTPVSFVVMGDSTSIGQGAEYAQGIARMSAQRLAATHRVGLTNVGISGARVADMRKLQLAPAIAARPDLVLIAIGANDVTHLTDLASVRQNITAVITSLQAANPHVRIILTGSPAMGSVPRFAPPTKWLAGWRVRRINAVFSDVASSRHVVLLPLAARTGPVFNQHPELFASDNFHPNAGGYAVWQPVIDAGLAKTGL